MNATERYQEIGELGEGAFKRVTLCLDKETQREVAFAMPSIHEEKLYESFLREARVNALLEHPNIVPVYDVGVDDFNVPFFVMKVLDGETFRCVLRQVKNDRDFCNLRKRLEIFLKVCDAMSHAHGKGIKHLDLKPENFQVNEFGAVQICDWGLAGINEDYGYDEFDYYDNNYRTLSGEVKGTPGYMAPEQARGEAGTKDNRTDIFALGAVLYEILCLNTPFGGRDIKEVIVSTCLEDAPLPSEVRPDLNIPKSLEAVAMKAISKEPEERYQSVDELRNEVESFLNGYATEAEEAGFSKQLALLYQRNKFFFNSSAFMFLLIIILGIVFYRNLELKNQESLASLLKLEQQEASLNENLQKLKSERQLNVKISPLTAKNYEMEAHRALIHKHDLELTEKHYLTAILLDPGTKLAQVIMARVAFIRQDYGKVIRLAEGLEITDRQIAVFAKGLQGKRRSIEEIYPLTKNMTKDHAGNTVKLCSWQYAVFQSPDIKKVEEDLNWLINQFHQGKSIRAKVSKSNDSYRIDLRDQHELENISYLKGAPINEIILSGTNVTDFDALRWTPKLKGLIIEDGRLEGHTQSSLNHLNITYEKAAVQK